MGVEAIVEAIGSEGEGERARIRSEAEERIARITADAEERSEAEMHRLETARDDEAARAAAAIVNRARLQADRELASIRESLFQEALGRLRRLLADEVAGPRYEEIMTLLYDEAVDVLDAAEAMVLVRPEDLELMSRIVDAAGHAHSIDASLSCIGGLDIEAADGRSVRNTIDARLARSDRRLRRLSVEMIPELAARVGDPE